jgi:hypothetical protein
MNRKRIDPSAKAKFAPPAWPLPNAAKRCEAEAGGLLVS